MKFLKYFYLLENSKRSLKALSNTKKILHKRKKNSSKDSTKGNFMALK